MKPIQSNTLINENAIAWISFSEVDGGLRAEVRFLVSNPHGQLVTEVFTGAAAEGLRSLVQKSGKTAETPQEQGSVSKVFDLQPIRKKKGWFFSQSGSRASILAFVNAKGSCSVRSYDAETGIFLGKNYRPRDYQDSFSDLIHGGVELTIDSQPNLERDCKERLPDHVLSYLKNQIKRD
jgi:hypothetical protein